MKYAVGDYISGKDLVFGEILAALDGDFPCYLMYSPKSKDNNWQTEIVLDKLGFKKATPEWDKYKNIKPGDMLHQKHDKGAGHMHRVLARVADQVLLSHVPIQKKETEKQKALRAQLSELADDFEKAGEDSKVNIHMGDLKESLKVSEIGRLAEEFITGRNAYDVAGDWMSVRDLTLMHWELLVTDE